MTFEDILRDLSPARDLSQLPADLAEEIAPGPELAQWLAATSPAQLDDFRLAGAVASWHRLAAWAQACELAAVAEIAARTAARDSSVPVDPEGSPAWVPSEATDEVALALGMSRLGAAWWVDLAVTLSWRLPATLAALRVGEIDFSRAKLIAESTSVLDDEGARAVQDKVLPSAGRQTLGQLRATLRRAVISVDPQAAERRRSRAERNARVGLYADEDGTATLAGHNLPGAQSAAAMARITALARAMKAAGADGGIDLLRAKAFLGLLLGTLPLIPPAEGPGSGPPEPTDSDAPTSPAGPGPDGSPTPAAPSDADAPRDEHPPWDQEAPHSDKEAPQDANSPWDQEAPQDGNPPSDQEAPLDETPPWDQEAPADDDVTGHEALLADAGAEADESLSEADWPDGADPTEAAGPGTTANTDRSGRWDLPWPGLPVPGDEPAPGCAPAWPLTQTRSPDPPPLTGKVRLTVTWPTLAGVSGEPGALCWLGPVTLDVAQTLARAAATERSCQWRVIVTGHVGEAVAVNRFRVRRPRRGTDPPASRFPLVGRVTVIVPEEFLGHPGTSAVSGISDDDALSGVLMTALEAAQTAFTAAAKHPDQGSSCDHRSASSGYRPPDRLREFIAARDQTCRFPGCRQPAWRIDQDHTIAFDKGGLTCSCNLGALCRTHHQLKQHRDWLLEQPVPGMFVWTGPSQRRHTVTPPKLWEPEA